MLLGMSTLLGGGAPVLPVSIGFVPYWDQDLAFAEVEAHRKAFTHVAPWWYAPTRDGDVVVQHEPHTDIDSEQVADLQRRGLAVMPSIANHRSGTWDFDVVGDILSSDERTAAHVAAIVDLVVDGGYDGIQMDYERLDPNDAQRYVAFIRDLAAALDTHDVVLAVAVHPATEEDAPDDTWSGGHDYEAIGRYADQVHVMAYTYADGSSEPRSIAPLPWVRDVVDYTLARVPAPKVVLGIGLFGYDWNDGSSVAVQVSEAEAKVRRYSGVTDWDAETASVRFRYQADGQEHEMWYESERSVEVKLGLVSEHDLAGAFFWRLGDAGSPVLDVVTDQLRTP